MFELEVPSSTDQRKTKRNDRAGKPRELDVPVSDLPEPGSVHKDPRGSRFDFAHDLPGEDHLRNLSYEEMKEVHRLVYKYQELTALVLKDLESLRNRMTCAVCGNPMTVVRGDVQDIDPETGRRTRGYVCSQTCYHSGMSRFAAHQRTAFEQRLRG